MPRALPLAAALLLLAPSITAAAGGEPPPARRPIRLSLNNPSAGPHQEVYVSGGVSTIITAPWKIRPRGTGLAGRARGPRPFELVLGSDRVFITPKRSLAPGEKWPLILRLYDDTVIPLVLVAPPAGRSADREVVTDLDNVEETELRVQLAAMAEQNQSLEARLCQALQEQDSADFALAQILAGGQVGLTALEKVNERTLVSDERGRILVRTYAPKADRHEPRKVAVVVTFTNSGAGTMAVTAGDLFSRDSLEKVPFAARTSGEVANGAKGALSVVVDAASIRADGTYSLELRVRRGGVVTDLSVDLAADEFDAGWRLF